MFFRRERPRPIGFEERTKDLQKAGFRIEPLHGGRVRVIRDGCAAVVENADPPRIVERAGVLLDGDIAKLVDGGFQKFFQTADGRRKPALSDELKAIHNFQEDLREGLGLTSLYNESLGTVSTQYLYDRVQDRDRGVPKRPWE
jgi:hypothetical protein